MNKIFKITLSLSLFFAAPVFAKTTVIGVDSTSRTLTLESRNEGVVANLFIAGLYLHGVVRLGYSSMDELVKLPKSDLITRIGHSEVNGQNRKGDVVRMYDLYQMNMRFNFVNNDYRLTKRNGQESLIVYGTVADDIMMMGLDGATGVDCTRQPISSCSFDLDL